MDGGDLLVGDEDIRIVDDGFHLIGIGDHVGGDVAAVELHAFDDFQAGLSGLGLFDGDDAGRADLIHGFRDQLADGLVAGGDGADSCDVVGALDGLGVGLDGLDGGLNGLFHALAHDHGVRACGDVLQTLVDDGLRQQGSGGGAVAGDVVGLGSDFADELRAHVLERILELDVLGDRHAVIGDQRRAELLAQNNVAALRAQGDLYGIGELVDAGQQGLAGLFAINNLLCHKNCFLSINHELFYYCQNVGHLDDDVIFAVELELLACVLAGHDLVATLDGDLDVVGARACGDHFCDHGFFLGGGGEDDAGCGLFLSFHVLEQNIVCQRGQLHNNYLQYPVAARSSAFYDF